MTYSVAVAGASGYGGGELLRLLANHPELAVRTVTAHTQAGQPLRAVHPHLASYGDLVLQATDAEVLAGHDVVFLALPHGHSANLAAQLPASTLVLDAGADHRLERAEDWAEYYGGDYAGCWTYGMPELVLRDGTKQRELLRTARRIAVPGCNVTAVTLALAPLMHHDIIDGTDLTAVLAVGPSGAGKKASTALSASELIGSITPYSPFGTHRHIPEIRQNLRRASDANVVITFTPVLVPAARGILATCSARMRSGRSVEDAAAALEHAYGSEQFIELLPQGSLPRTGDVIGSNRTQLAIGYDERSGRLIACSAIDNLGKGTAGAAIQSANIALGVAEATALTVNGVAP